MKREGVIKRLREQLRGKKLPALLVTSPVNLCYLSGFTGTDSAGVVTEEELILLTDFRFVEQATKECPGWKVVEHPGVARVDWISAFLSEKGIPRLGLEADHLTWNQYMRLGEAAPKLLLEPTLGMVEELRIIKQAWEIERIRGALRAGEAAFEAMRGFIRAGVTEKEVADELERQLRHAGAQRSGFETIVAFDANGSLPHARPGKQALGKKGAVLVDWGAEVEGYNSDLTRVLCSGRVTTKFEKVYGVVLGAQKAGIEAVGPGVKAGEVDGAAREVIARAGYGERFGHGLGHGVGLEVHEGPTVRGKSEDVLMPGMVITIEPGIYIPGWGGIRIEDMVLVTKKGREVLSSVGKELEETLLG